MKVRHKNSPDQRATASRFNTHGLGEMIVYFHDPDDCDSDFIRDYEVFLEATQQWKDMSQAFKDHDLITDNYNTEFFEPKDDAERQRGYRL